MHKAAAGAALGHTKEASLGNILDKPYFERRVLVIHPTNEQEAQESTVDWGKAGAAGLVSTLLLPTLLGPIGILSYLAYELLKPKGGNGKGPYLAVTAAQAADELQFPPGHPILDHAYVGHPLVSERYIPFARFHSHVFEQKVSELMTIIASLGAVRARVVSKRGYRTSTGIEVGVPATPLSPSVGAKAEKTTSGKQHLVMEEHFTPRGKPHVPDSLLWYPHEPMWEALATRRLSYGTRTFKTSLSYEDNFGVDMSLKVGLEKLNFKLGGSFSDFESTLWEFEGEFGED